MGQNTRIYALAAVTFVLILILGFVYLYQPASALHSTTSANTLEYNAFMQENNLPNYTGLFQLYGSPSNDSIVFDCKYEITPQLIQIPSAIQNSSAAASYDSLSADMGILSFCSVNNTISSCSSAYDAIKNYMLNQLNSTDVSSIYNQTYYNFQSFYITANESGVLNFSYFNPLRYDAGILTKNPGNESVMIKKILSIQELPEDILLDKNGSVLKSDVYAIGPFQFKLKYIPAAQNCSTGTKVFNLIVDSSAFESQAYSSIYRDIGGNITNICVKTQYNQCNASEMKSINASFYVT